MVRNPFGKISRRYAVTTRGTREGAYGALRIEHTFIFDSGEVEVATWSVTEAGEGRYVVAESEAGSGLEGRLVEGDFAFAFRRRFLPMHGFSRAKFSTRMTLVEPETAVAVTQVHFFGAPLAVLTAIHRRIGP